MRKAIILLVLFLGMSGCGENRAPIDALVTGPDDKTFAVTKGSQGAQVMLEFQVKNQAGTALPKVEIEYIATNGTLLDRNGNPPPNPNTLFFLKDLTDDLGLGRIFFLITFPPCTATVQTIEGDVTTSVGVDNHEWKGTFTIPVC